MSISRAVPDLELAKFVESSTNAGQPAVAVVNPDGSSIFGGSGANLSIFTSAARTTAQQSSDQSGAGGSKLILFLNVSAASGTGGLTIRVTGKDAISGNYFPMNAAPSAITAIGQYAFTLGTGCTQTGGAVAQATSVPVPNTWRVEIAVGDSSSYTYSISAQVID